LPKDKRPTAQELVDEASTELTAKSDLPDALRSDLLLTLAKVAEGAGAYEQATTLLDHNTPIAQRLYSTADTQWWDERVTRALVLRGQAHFEDVVALLNPLREGLRRRHDQVGIDGVMLLGNALLHVGHVDEGLQLVREAREIAFTEAPHLPDAYVLSTLIAEESTLTDAQKFREALDCGDAALALWQRQGSPPSQSIIALYSAIALDSEAIGDIPRAEAAYKESIALGDKFFDKANPSTAWNVGMYGTFLIAQGRLAEAEPFVRRGLEMRRKVFGEENSRTLNAVAGMGKLYAGLNRFPEAEQWYTQGIDVCRKITLNDVVCPRLLSNRARAYSNEARFPDAERDIREALQLQEKVGGDANPAYAYILDSLVVVQLKQHQDDAAVASADRSLAIYKDAKGGMLQSALSTRFLRALALYESKHNDEALQEILEIEPKYSSLFPNGTSRFNMLLLKARALAVANRSGEAKAAALDALSQTKKPPSLDPKVIAELNRLAGNP
jgi:serine/threonine-protein kinase